MAFGIKRAELLRWKKEVSRGRIAFITHYWLDPRFPQCKTVTKAGCADVGKLIRWGEQYGLKKEWLDYREDYPHFDLIGERQQEILLAENLTEHIARFRIIID